MGTYRLQGFGDFNPGQMLTDTITQAQQRVSTAGLFAIGMVAVVALAVWTHSR